MAEKNEHTRWTWFHTTLEEELDDCEFATEITFESADRNKIVSHIRQSIRELRAFVAQTDPRV